ncbi:MAG: tRNA (adenosine(37)-N6)-threonylcarbamoyltransferase complex dimerization subunit type 1 TsaB [Ignavibacteriae bacterium]|nr:MAG: tRNA (adenosine(37)-N6)-threonylcarbamoyltransferase complex dimerization subunit type 1 TsaB [Ignavibacteriota bacterium]
MKERKILTIETSGELCSIALVYNENKFDERNILMKHIHSEKLIPMIESILTSNNIKAKDLNLIAVSNGPGSFTGLRIGMTVAKGIAFAANLPIIPIPTFEALALEISSFLPDSQTFCIINNANSEECYFSKYETEGNTFKTLIENSLVKKEELKNKIDAENLIYGNYQFNNNVKNICSPRATSLAKWIYLFGEDLVTLDYDYLEPNYLKKFKVKTKQ